MTRACDRLSSYLLGLKFTLETDHKLLVSLLSTKKLDQLPPRVLRFCVRLMRFDYDIIHVPGKQLISADVLSRVPTKHTLSEEEMEQEAHLKVFIDSVVQGLPATETRLKQIVEEQKADSVCGKIHQYCQSGWPEKKTCGHIGKNEGIFP